MPARQQQGGQPLKSRKRSLLARRLAWSCGVSMVAGLAAGTAQAQAEAPAAPAPAASAASAASAADAAPAADAPKADASGPQQLGEVTVTARRRNEALVDVPLAISVVTAQKMEQLGIKSTTDLANYVPGLDFNNFTPGNSRNDRGSGRALVFRGLNVSTVGGAGGSMFLNGAAVLGNEVPSGLDLGQVEILRGPQSVYFGRATMTGAVSYRTRSIPDKLSGEVQVEYAQRDTKELAATIAGPLVPNLLKGRLTALSQETGGYVTNTYNNGASMLGATSRKSLSTTLELTPFAELSFKGYFNVFKDDDGPAATAFIPSSLNNCKLGTTQTTFCGEIPGRENSINYINTTIPAGYLSIFNTPLISGKNFDTKIGQQREAQNSDIVANWDISDYLHFQSITGYHTNVTMSALDGFAQPYQPSLPAAAGTSYFYTFTNKFQDFSQEVRLSSSPDERLSWTFGANYIKTTIWVSAITGRQALNATTPTVSPQALGAQMAETTGVFGGLYYKVTPKFTLSAEARQQEDDRRATSTSLVTGATVADLSKTFKSFTPRVSADYDIGGRRKIYASYAEGNRPGGFNTGIAQFANNPTALAEIAQKLGTGGEAYDEERLKIWELGFKGELPNNTGYFDVNAYLGTLTNQQITLSAPIVANNNNAVSGTFNAGESKIHGIEFQGSYNFTPRFSLSGTFAWNYTKRTKFQAVPGRLAQFGTTDFSGKAFAYVPEYSGSVVASYTQPMGDRWSLFSNVATTYRGKMYADDFNASYIKGRYQTDLRVGMSDDRFSIEGYVKNLFNDQNYTGGNVAPDFGGLTGNSFFGGWAPPRQIGVRMTAKF